MKKLLAFSLFLSLLSCAGHFYLAKRAYELSAGVAEKSSVCHINEEINCDQALLSPYAKIFNVSISNFGFSVFVILSLILIVLLKFNLENYWKNILFYLSAFTGLASVGMIVISLLYSLYCPICWSLYVVSFLLLACLFVALRKALSWSFFAKMIQNQNTYFLGAGILLTAFFMHASFSNIYELKDKDEISSVVFRDWQSEMPVELDQNFLIQKGQGDIVLVEFADFLCPSCLRVKPDLDKILNYFSDIKFLFYAYPLDGPCNEAFPVGTFGLRCELAKALVCSKDKSWEFHNFFFKNQKKFLSYRGDINKSKKLLDQIVSQTALDKEVFANCMKDNDTLKKAKLSGKAGEKLEIIGTPTFFVNGKQLRGPFSFVTFNKIYQHIKSQ